MRPVIKHHWNLLVYPPYRCYNRETLLLTKTRRCCLKGQCSEIFILVFALTILTHLVTLVICWTIFAYGFNSAEIFACAKNSAVSVTLLSQTSWCHRSLGHSSSVKDTKESHVISLTPRSHTPWYHWHQGVTLRGIIDTKESHSVV